MAKKFVLTAELKVQSPQNIDSVVNQINSRLKDVKINFQLQNASRSIKDLDNISRSSDKAAESVTKVGNAFGVSLKRFAAFSIASRAIGLFSNRISGAIEKAIDFQNEVVRLSQITGQTIPQLKGLTDQIGQLATTLGVSSDKIVSVTDILAQAGLQANDLRIAINTLAKTELAPTFGKIQDTAEGAVAILAQFGEGVGALERQLGAINKVSAKFAVESEDLISVVRRTGGVFKASGGSLEELLALFTSVRATTRESAESIATALRTIFTRLQRPQTIEYLKQLGVELTDINGKFVGPFEATKRLSQALSALGEGDVRFIQIAEELGGYRQIGKVIPLLRQFELSEKALQAAQEGRTSLDEDVATSQQSLQRQFIKTQEAFLKLVRDISETSSFQILIKSSLNFANALIKIADSIKPLIPLIATFAAIKFTQNIGGFFAGLGAGFKQIVGPQTKASGGKIMAFARGGLVPGTGNGDTVPAMLSPGEFVIRKSSVNKIGADKLAAMNENKYASGGKIKDLVGRKPSLKTKYDAIKDRDLFEDIDIQRKKDYTNYWVYRTDAAEIVNQATKKKDANAANKYIKKQIGPNINIDRITDKTLKRWQRIKQENPGKASYEIKWGQAPNKIQGALLEKNVLKKYGKIEKLPNEAGADFWLGENRFAEAKNKLEPTDDNELKAKALLGHAYKMGNKKNGKIDTVPKLSIDLISTNPKDIPKNKFFGGIIQKFANGGFVRKYAIGTDGKGVAPLSLDENIAALSQRWGISIQDMKEIQKIGPSKLAELVGYGKTRGPFDVRSPKKFNGNLAKQALAKSREALKQKVSEEQSLPQYGAAILKKRNNFNLEQNDGTGRKFMLRSVYMGQDDAKRIQDLVAKSGAEQLINDVANYMTSAIGENKVSSTGQIPNLSAITGSIFEAALRRVDGSVEDSDPDKLTFDFPSGLGPQATKVFGVDSSVLAGIKTDAKFSSSDDARKSIQRKVRKDLDEQLVPRPQKEGVAPSASMVGKNVKVTNNPKRANGGGGIQTAKNTSQKQAIRNVGYIDSDVLNSPQNKAIVEQEIEKLQAQGIKIEGGYRGYKKYLNDLAIKARKSNTVNKLTNIVGMAGSGKSTLMLGNKASDNASLRQTNRFPIIKPEDIARASSIINVTATLDQQGVEDMNLADRTVALSSSTKQEQDLLRKRRKKRDREIAEGTSETGFGRSSGSTKSAPVDSGYFEALLQSGLTDPKKLLTLGITEKGFRRKKGAELPKVLEEKINLYYGNFGPASRGHELARQEGLKQSPGAKSLVAVGIDTPVKQDDEHSYRSALLSQKERVAMAQKVFKDSYVTKATKDQFGFSLPSLYDVGTSESGQRTFIKPAQGSTATVGDEKDEKSLAKYKRAGLDVVTLPRIEGISGTKLREAIMSNNIEEMKNLTTAEGFDFLKDKTSTVKNRADILPKIMDKVSAKSKKKLADIESELSKYPARLSKTTPSDVKEKVEGLRKQRDKIKASAETRPLRIMERLKSFYPDKYKFNSGGQAPSDTVPALLTPGEFVINKESAQSIGYGNLNRMNKQGVAGFAKGGPVAVQKFAEGTGPKGVTSFFSFLDSYSFASKGKPQEVDEVTKSQVKSINILIKKYEELGISRKNALDLAVGDYEKKNGGNSLTKQTQAVVSAEKKRIEATNKNTKTTAPSTETSTQQQKAEKDANASFVQFSAFTGAINTAGVALSDFAKNADGSSTAASRLIDSFLGIANQVSTVVFALQQFGVSLNAKGLKEFFGSGKGSIGDRLTGGSIGRRAASLKKAEPLNIATGTQNRRKAIQTSQGGGANFGIPKSFGRLTGGFDKLLGSVSRLAGPLAAVGGSAFLVSSAFNSVIGSIYNFDEQLKSAIESGNVEKGIELAEKNASLQAANTSRVGGAAAGAATGALLGSIIPGLGTAIGSVAGAIVGTIGASFASEDMQEKFSVMIGGDTKKSIVDRAKAELLASRYTIQHADNVKAATAAIEGLQNGTIEADKAMDLIGKNALNAGNALEASLQAAGSSQANKSSGGIRDVLVSLGGGLLGIESSSQRNSRIDKENVKGVKENFDKASAELDNLLSGPIAQKLIRSGKSTEEVLEGIKQSGTGPAKVLKQIEEAAKSANPEISKLGKAALETAKISLDAATKQAKNQIELLKSLNLGLFKVISGAEATSSAFEAISAQIEGTDPLTKSIKILEAATTNQAAAMNPKEVQSATQTFADSLRASGLDETNIQRNVSALQATFQTQAGLGASLENAKSTLINAASNNKTAISSISEAIINEATKNIADPNQKATIRSRLGTITEDLQGEEGKKIIDQVAVGDISGILKLASSKLQQAASQQIEVGNLLAKNQKDLANVIEKRTQAELKAAEAANKAIDIQLEAAEAIQEFGGKRVGIDQKRSALIQKTQNITGVAGIQIGTGSSQDLLRAKQQVDSELISLQRAKQTSNFTAQDAIREKQLLTTSDQLIDSQRSMIDLAKQELEIAKKRNSLERDSLDKLLGGDIKGALEDMAASAATSFLKSGDVGAVSLLGPGAARAALKNLEETGASSQEKAAASRTLGSAFNISPLLTQSFSGESPEVQLANQRGIDAANALSAMSRTTAQIANEEAEAFRRFESTQRQNMGANLSGGPVNFTLGQPQPIPSVPRAASRQVPQFIPPAGSSLPQNQAAAAKMAGVAGSNRPSTENISPQGVSSIGISPEIVKTFSSSIDNFVAAIDKLQNMQLSVKFDTGNINVNINGGSFLGNFSEKVQEEIMNLASKRIREYRVGGNGELTRGNI